MLQTAQLQFIFHGLKLIKDFQALSKIRMQFLILAFGTRGDVLPLIELATELNRCEVEILFVTHEAHQQHIFDAWCDANGIRCLFTDTVPVAVYDHERFSSSFHEDILIEVASAHYSAIVCNLFGLEAWHMCEALNLPLIIFSPSRPPSHRPSHALTSIKLALPDVYQLLCNNTTHDKLSITDIKEW